MHIVLLTCLMDFVKFSKLRLNYSSYPLTQSKDTLQLILREKIRVFKSILNDSIEEPFFFEKVISFLIYEHLFWAMIIENLLISINLTFLPQISSTATLRGVRDKTFFLFRLAQIFA